MATPSEIHEKTIVIAAHADIVASDCDYRRLQGERAVFEKRHVPILRRGGVTAVGEALGGDTRYVYLPAVHVYTDPLHRTMRIFDDVFQEIAESDSLIQVLGVADILEPSGRERSGCSSAWRAACPSRTRSLISASSIVWGCGPSG